MEEPLFGKNHNYDVDDEESTEELPMDGMDDDVSGEKELVKKKVQWAEGVKPGKSASGDSKKKRKNKIVKPVINKEDELKEAQIYLPHNDWMEIA
jgi:hypothetical protein